VQKHPEFSRNPQNFERKLNTVTKLLKNQVAMLVLIHSSAMLQWFSKPPLPMLSIIFPNAGVITIGAT
jgi:hypothetical protein